MKTVQVTIEGLTPLLMSKYNLEEASAPAAMRRTTKLNKKTPQKEAEDGCYVDEKTSFIYVPSSWIMGTMKNAAANHKQEKSRKNMKSVIGYSVFPSDERYFFNEKHTLSNVEVDLRAVVNPNTRMRLPKARAKFTNWSFTFKLEVDDSCVNPELLHIILDEAGQRVGIGDYRPAKSGPFGRFKVVNFKEVK